MTLNGLDLASYQAGLHAGTIAGDFNIVKATEGVSYVNPSCNIHVTQTLAAGKRLGLYHFANYGTNAVTEADYFLANIKNYIGKGILVLDYEADAVKNGVNWAKQWLDRVYAKTGVRPLIYLGLADENAYDWSPIVKANYGLWIAQYNNYNAIDGYQPRKIYGKIKHWSTAAIFQYTSSGRLPGWGNALDFNVFYGNKTAWDAYAKPDKVTTPKPAPNPATPKRFKDSLGDTWYYESAKFRLNKNINLRWGAKTNSALIATLPAGTTVKYDAYSFHNGYVWLRQPRSGGYGYLASGTESGGKRTSSWGTFR